MHAATIAAIFFAISGAAPTSLVDERVDTIAIFHSENAEFAYFFDFIQGDWSVIDHRVISSEFRVYRDGADWVLTFDDWGDECLRAVRAEHWFEVWQEASPREEENQRPWFRQQAEPGLRSPPKLAAKD